MLDQFYTDFLKGIKEYNNKDFFECHDTWEEIWHELKGIDRLFVQGLIHSAIGHYHLRNKNWKGARSQFEKCRKKLEPYGPLYRGINIAGHLEHLKTTSVPFTEKIERREPVELSESSYPTLELAMPSSPGDLQTQIEQLRVSHEEQLRQIREELKNNVQKNAALKHQLEQWMESTRQNASKPLKPRHLFLSLLIGVIVGIVTRSFIS
jgi:predicted metal-dependent hydrolase